MTGNGFSASIADAEALAGALGTTGDAPAEALASYEQSRLQPAQQLVRSGQQFSRSFARGAA